VQHGVYGYGGSNHVTAIVTKCTYSRVVGLTDEKAVLSHLF